jgi:hypothetical protein
LPSYYLIFIVNIIIEGKRLKKHDNIKMPNFSAFCGTLDKPPQNFGVPVNQV